MLFVGFAIGTIVGVLAPVTNLEREKIAPLRGFGLGCKTRSGIGGRNPARVPG
ncbi:MAG: hypothetical protein IAI48_08200 [Candidatus Eremiobacteraeota bacterium]|nr:hypothetical protein [Candidatus Eremiobacteraeota bacterium]